MKEQDKIDWCKAAVISVVIWLLTTFALLIAQVDTEALYKFDRMKLNEQNDCTVRAYASLFDTPYTEAHEIISKIRKNKEGVQGLVFGKYVLNLHRDKLSSTYNYVDMRNRTAPMEAFLETRAKHGFRYLIFTYEHVFVMKYDYGKWKAYGNKGDETRDVIAYIEFKE